MKKSYKTKTTALFAACAGVVLLAGCDSGKNAVQHQMPPQEVLTVLVETKDLTVGSTLNGRTSAYYEAEVRPQVSGILQKRLFKEGAEVKAGEPLYQIDPKPYIVALKSAEASLAQAEAALVKAKADAARADELIKVNAISVQDYDAVKAQLKTANAQEAAAKAALEDAKINLGYTKVESPISGRVSRSEFTEGALLQAYQQTKLTSVQQLDPIYVDVTQSFDEMTRIKQEIKSGALKADEQGNARVTLKFADGTTYSHEGKLAFTDAQVEESTGSVRLRAVFPNPDRELLPGMYVRADLVEGVRPQGIAISMQCVMRDAKGQAYVYVVDSENKVQKRDVAANQTAGTDWIISSGLKAGERVVFEGFQRIKAGSQVVAKDVEPDEVEANPVFK